MTNLNLDRKRETLKEWFEDGCCQKELQPSLLGLDLDWQSFHTRKFTEVRNDIRFWNPPEFIYYGYSALDAYAVAILAANFDTHSLGALTFTCKLTLPEPECESCLELVTSTEHGCIDLDRIITEIGDSFPKLLLSKGIDTGPGEFLEGDGCPIRFKYPGRMKSSVSRFLRDRSKDLWPEATLTVTPTADIRTRSQTILNFLRDSEPASSNPN